MADVTVYDKISWHYPEGRNCPSLEVAKQHFSILVKWLDKNELLSAEGKEILELGIDADFSVTSSMLNEKGNVLLKEKYSRWLKTIDYSNDIDLTILNSGLRE